MIGKIVGNALFCVLGIALLLFGFMWQRQADGTGTWLRDDNARILGTSIQTGKMYLGNGPLGTCYRGIVRYSYATPQGAMEGNSMYPAGSPCKNVRKEAERLIAPYAANQQVTVFFNPHNPRQSCLKPEKRSKAGTALMVMGGLCIVMALVRIRSALTPHRPSDKQNLSA